MTPVRIGIVGLGRMGLTHHAIANSSPDAKVVAIADPSKMVLTFMRKYADGVEAFADAQEMLKKVALDALIVCTPPGMHARVSRMAAGHNLHVFCEKPFTTSATEAYELADLFETLNLVNQVGYVNRFNDVFVRARELLVQGVIGNVKRFKSEMYSGTVSKPGSDTGWRSDRQHGGGALYEMASHAIDLVQFLVGKPDKITGASLSSIYSHGVDDAVTATLLYTNGVVGTLNVNWSDVTYRKPTNKIEVLGTRGKLLVDQHSMRIFLLEGDNDRSIQAGWNTRHVTDVFRPVPFYVRGNEFSGQIYHFIDAITRGRPDTACTFRQGAATLEVIEAIISDHREHGILTR
jgi:predicted dehydrogenase